MDMWCPYSIGREISEREVRLLDDPDLSPPRGGDLPSWCVSLRGCSRIDAQRIIVVVVAVAAVAERIIML